MSSKQKNPTSQKGKKVIPLYVSEEIWGKLKLLAVKRQTNMNELCREGIEYVIKKYNI
ncbi:MAG: hypothetical protein WCC83_01950 [Candidatus Rickettsiella isopodorum]|jgi:hypothetical protein